MILRNEHGWNMGESWSKGNISQHLCEPQVRLSCPLGRSARIVIVHARDRLGDRGSGAAWNYETISKMVFYSVWSSVADIWHDTGTGVLWCFPQSLQPVAMPKCVQFPATHAPNEIVSKHLPARIGGPCRGSLVGELCFGGGSKGGSGRATSQTDV